MSSAPQFSPLHAADIRVLAFDIFGTVVDWHGSIAAEVDRLGLGVDGAAFALAWRAGYQPAMARVMAGIRAGSGSFRLIDDLHREILETVLADFGVDTLDEQAKAALNRVWHRLDAWPDAVAGLARLKQRFIITSLSNGNLGLLTNMAKRAGLPWDCLLSAEVFQAYKPDPVVYLGVARVFDVAPSQVMLVAAHHDDLAGARACGLRTAYVERPWELGHHQPKDVSPDSLNDLHARDLLDLAVQLGA